MKNNYLGAEFSIMLQFLWSDMNLNIGGLLGETAIR